MRWSTFAIARPAAASVSAGLASTSFWYAATAPSMSPASSASWAGAYRGSTAGSSPSSAGSGAAVRGWCRVVTPWAVSCCTTWVNAARSSSSGSASWKSGIGRPSSTATTSGTDGICIAWAICGTASMSTRPSRKRPSNSSDRVFMSSASWALAGCRVGE